LIEAMGLFILPGRLKKQLYMIAEILCGKVKFDMDELSNPENYLYAHRFMIEDLVKQGLKADMESAERAVTDRVNDTCRNILYNTAVFKNDDNGVKGFERFLKANGIN